MKKATQRIHYVRTRDGVQLAWAGAGEGPVVIKAANWLTHLEYEWESPVWQHWIRFFTDNFRFIRHDERGCGMSDWKVGELSLERWIQDLEDIVAAAGLSEPFTLLGISQGAATCPIQVGRDRSSPGKSFHDPRRRDETAREHIRHKEQVLTRVPGAVPQNLHR